MVYNRWKCGLKADQVLTGAHVRRNGFKSLCGRGKVEAVRAWAIGEQSSCSDVKQLALEYFGQRKLDIVNDDGTTNSVAQKHLDQQSVLLTWNGPWGEFFPGSVIAWGVAVFSGSSAMARGTLFFQSAQVF